VRFVQPLTDTLTLANGDTLTVRRRLNVGEQRESFAACSALVKQEDGQYERVPDPLKIGIARAASYLLEWRSVEDAAPPLDGLDLAGRLAVLDNLEPDDFYLIRDAITAHEAKYAAARLEEKKRPTGPTSAEPILRSPFDVVGASTG
jgi:hypothetical protein